MKFACSLFQGMETLQTIFHPDWSYYGCIRWSGGIFAGVDMPRPNRPLAFHRSKGTEVHLNILYFLFFYLFLLLNFFPFAHQLQFFLRWYGSQSKLLLKTENSITTNQLQEGIDNRGGKKAADSFIKLQTIMQLFSLKLLMSFLGNTKHMLAN